jgi:hypothetical protein
VIAALFVRTNGCYFGLPDVDPWDKERDARKYDGPYPVVAHPPCERWGRYWFGSPMMAGRGIRLKKGDDNGCFAAAIAAVRKWGGVLEHPEASAAWSAFGLSAPPKSGGWVAAGDFIGWTCCVEQGWYGHRARKATWLYYVGKEAPPALKWGKSPATEKLEESFRSKEQADRVRAERKALGIKPVKRIATWEREATPIPFRDLLLSIARTPALGKKED